MGKKQLFLGITTVLLLTIMISCANATRVKTVQVAPLSSSKLIFDLDKGDKFSGSLAISGGANNDINFQITDPSGNTVVNLGRISQGTTFGFSAQESGAYTFDFDNTFSLISWKTVSLSFDISSSAPFDIGWVLIVIGVLLIAIGIIGLSFWLYHRKMQTLRPSQPMPT